MLDFLVKKVTNYIVDTKIIPNHQKEKSSSSGISDEIQTLKELQEELLKRDEELRLSRVEWDRTFDAIIDNIVIIGKGRTVLKANRSFIDCIRKNDGNWKELIGRPWNDVRQEMGMTAPCIVDKCFVEGVYQESVLYIGDRIYSVLTNPVHDINGNIQSVVRVSRDITKMEQQKQKIDRRGRIFEAISNMSKTLVDHSHWDTALSDILRYLGESVEAKRAYIFTNEVKEDRICANLNDVWVDSSIKGCAMTECVNYSLLPTWKEDLEMGNTVEGKIQECLHCPDKERCVHLSNVEICAVPIFANKKWWGFIGFDYDSKIKKWKDDDEAILRVAADIIGGVVHHRERYYKCLDKKEEGL